MKIEVRMSEAEIKAALAERFGVKPDAVTLRVTAEQRDGPHYSPGSVGAVVQTDMETIKRLSS